MTPADIAVRQIVRRIAGAINLGPDKKLPELSCMGGWCKQRKVCALHNTVDRRMPSERLCERGADWPHLVGGDSSTPEDFR